ncbi:MAG: hypothetical protein EP347_12555, partial [Alphaproteobacteria bacterium]
MRRLSGLIFVLFWTVASALPLQAQVDIPAEEIFDHPLMEKDFTVPDHSSDYTRLKTRIEDIASKYKLMKAGTTDTDLDARLVDLFSTDNPQRFYEEYGQEIEVANRNFDLAQLQNLGRYYLNRYRHDDAKAVFFHVQRVSQDKRQRAQALAYMAEAYLGDDDKKTALNLFYLSLEVHRLSNAQYRFNQLREETDMLLKDIAVNAESDVPSACMIFSQDFKAGFDPEGYLEITPSVDADIYAQKDRICVRGLKHGAGYTFKIKKGVPSAGGPALRRDLERTFKVPNMSERIVFSSGAYVLPKSKDELIPLRTVNLEEIELELLRINDRNMVNAIFTNTFERDLSTGDLRDLEYTQGEKIWEGSVSVAMKLNR